MIPQHIYLGNYRCQKGVTSSYMHVLNFQDHAEQKKLEFLISNFKKFQEAAVALCSSM
jgi:hypothetical protein